MNMIIGMLGAFLFQLSMTDCAPEENPGRRDAVYCPAHSHTHPVMHNDSDQCTRSCVPFSFSQHRTPAYPQWSAQHPESCLTANLMQNMASQIKGKVIKVHSYLSSLFNYIHNLNIPDKQWKVQANNPLPETLGTMLWFGFRIFRILE